MHRLITLLFAVLLSASSQATITTALSNGDWLEPATWSNGVPGCIDTIVIPAGIQVDITSTIDLEACPDSILVLISGNLEFQNGKKLKLPCLSDVVLFHSGYMGVGSGGGASTYLEMCSTQYWNADNGNLTGPVLLCDGPCPGSQLPIELLSFTANLRPNDRIVDLNWVTLSEQDNDYFIVERSANGEDWEFVVMVDGAGNSSITLSYDEVDENPMYGVSYYRLKQVDFNGQYTYSPSVSVASFTDDQLLLYPNPVQQGDYVVVQYPEGFYGTSDFNIYSMDGRLIYTTSIDISETKQTLVKIDDSYAAGCYTIHTKFGNTRFMVK